ncbi:MAG: hypothetical protein J5947_03270, partial [Clostridium sp.]|nr:hypothetical protein [Clostridium sp.]
MNTNRWKKLKRAAALLLTASLIAGSASFPGAVPAYAAQTRLLNVEWNEDRGNITLNLDAREVWQAADRALREEKPVEEDLRRLLRSRMDGKNPVVEEETLYELELPSGKIEDADRLLEVRLFAAPASGKADGDSAILPEYPESEEGDQGAKATGSDISGSGSEGNGEETAEGRRRIAKRKTAVSDTFSLLGEDGEYADGGITDTYSGTAGENGQTAGEAGDGTYRLTGRENLYFLLCNKSDKDLNYTVKLGGEEILKTKVLRCRNDKNGGPASASVLAATGSGLDREAGGEESSTASNLKKATASDKTASSVTGHEAARLARVNLDGCYVRYEAELAETGRKVTVITTGKMSWRRKDGSLTLLPANPALTVREILPGSAEYLQTEETLRARGVKYTGGFIALDISFMDHAGHACEPAEGQIVNVRIETENLPENADLTTLAIQHLGDTLEAVAGTTIYEELVPADENAEDAGNAASDEEAGDGASGRRVSAAGYEGDTAAETEDAGAGASEGITVDTENNTIGFNTEKNLALMKKSLSQAGDSDFSMKLENGETGLVNDLETKGQSGNTGSKTSGSAAETGTVKTESVREENGLTVKTTKE